MEFTESKVYNFYNAIRGMRNSYESWDRMDSYHHPPLFQDHDNVNIENFEFGEADYKLAMKLAKAGSDHGKFMRQILLSVDITAPEYWWAEQATYKVGTVENSTSTMHKFGTQEIAPNMFTFDGNLDEDYLDYLNLIRRVQEKWLAAGGVKHSKSPEWRKLIQLNARAFNYTRTCTLNYAVLRNMYHARKKHRLYEWQEMCDWIETLPYSELITC